MTMRFLLLSDIHHNLAAVERMRAQELNEYDAVVVAGDMGSESAAKIFDLLKTFECPVLYIYGNWDRALDYGAPIRLGCHHLHLSPFKCGQVSFVGFSGCTAGWGQNPYARRLQQEVDDTYAEVTRALVEAEADDKTSATGLKTEYDARTDSMKAAATARKPVSQRQLKALSAELEQALEALPKITDGIMKTEAYTAYSRQLASVSAEALAQNRSALSQTLAVMETPRDRTIVVTHDRLFKTQADLPGIGAFIFGHRHGFAATRFQGAQFINVSALDIRQLIRPKTFSRGDHWEQFRNLNVGNYAVLEWDERGGFNVRCEKLGIDPLWQENWEVEVGTHMPGAPFLT